MQRVTQLLLFCTTTIALSFILLAQDVDTSRSEMRATIERYTADRAIQNRSAPIDFSAAHLARMKQFYSEWLSSQEQKMMSMRGNNIHFARATVFHELIPGHHLQGFMNARYRTHRSAFSTPFSVEGWSLYWEMLLWNLDFAKGPENKVGMLFWRMHRAARIIFSLNFHLGKMSVEESIDYLVKLVGHEVDNATAEVRRSFSGQDGPLYQAAYMLGGLQIRALRQELVDSGRMTNRAFHDAILKENRIPVEMVRASLGGQKLSKDFASSWKFYGPSPLGAAR